MGNEYFIFSTLVDLGRMVMDGIRTIDCISNEIDYQGEDTAARDEALAQLSKIDESGTPLFSKKQLSDAMAQMKEATSTRDKQVGASRFISLEGLDGSVLKLPVYIGETITDNGILGDQLPKDAEQYWESLYLRYYSIAYLLNARHDQCTDYFHPITVRHRQGLRHRVSKEPIARSLRLPLHGRPHSGQAVEEFKDNVRKYLSMQGAPKPQLDVFSPHRLGDLDFPKVTKIIGFGLGVITYPRNGPHYQHALLLKLQKHFSDAKIYTQDPDSCKVEHEVMQEAGINIVHDPEGFVLVDEETVVVSMYPNAPVCCIVADIARPAAIIWRRVEEEKCEEKLAGTTNPHTPKVVEMMKHYYQCYPIEDDADAWLGVGPLVAMYIRRDNNKDMAGGSIITPGVERKV